jgi:hypothetical protein
VSQVSFFGSAETAEPTDNGYRVVIFAGSIISKRANDVGPNVLGKLRQRKRLFIAGHAWR